MIILVVEGPDGVGKSVLAKRIVRDLKENHVNAQYMHFPNYNYHSGAMIQDFLFGKFGDFKEVPYEMQQWLYCIDRYAWQYSIDKDIADSTVFVCDRYYTSSMIYQVGNIYYHYLYLPLKEKMEEEDTSKVVHYVDMPSKKTVDGAWWDRIDNDLLHVRPNSDGICSLAAYSEFIKRRETMIMGIHEPDLIIGLTGADESIMSRKDQHVQASGIAKDNFEDDDDYVRIINDTARVIMSRQGWKTFSIDEEGYSDEASKYVLENLKITPSYIIK